MALGDAKIGIGTTVTFQSGLVAKITNLDFGDVTREAIEIRHSDLTAALEFIPDVLYDAGELSATVIFDDSSAYQATVESAAESVTLTLPVSGTSAATYVASGFATSYSIAVPMDDVITADITIKLTGAITDTVGA